MSFSLYCLPFLVTIGSSQELEGTVHVSGNLVRVEVTYENQLPAEGARIKLRDNRGTVVAEGHANSTGTWLWELNRPGEYEVSIEHATLPENSLSLPITVKFKPTNAADIPACCRARASRNFDWLLLGLSIGLLGSATLLLRYFRDQAALRMQCETKR